MKTVMNIHQFALQTPEYRAQQTPAAEFAKFKASFEAGAGERITADDWASQLRAMMSANAGDPSTVKATTLVVVATQDHMVNPLPAIAFAHTLVARLLQLTGNCGHLAICCQAAMLNTEVSAFQE
jgi:homoserine O-acetyltransferase